ncbi:MAG TPA: serine hydrolase domain-containing protein, partial [Xanthomonadales bacterium]|nr:serine hydrolase domain-containing protein [Xanthomonadales bacterium]
MLEATLTRFLPLACSVAMTLFCTTTSVASTLDVTDPAVVEAFVDGVVKPTMKENHSPSGVVMVMKDGQVVFAKGYGYIDVEQRIPVDPVTSLFRPGSISKLFTWVSVMQLVEQGKLDLDADVNQYLETFKIEDTFPGQPITLRHIMTHTPGFEDGGLGYLITNDESRIMPLAESLAKYQPDRINPPGTHTSYSNYGT